MFRFFISRAGKDKSKYSTTITLGLYLLKSNSLKAKNSEPSISTDSKSISKFLYLELFKTLLRVSVSTFLIFETFAF